MITGIDEEREDIFDQTKRVYVGPRVGAHICLNLGVGLDRILHHTAMYLRVVARLPLAIYISAWGGRSSLAILLAAMHQLMLLRQQACHYQMR